MLTAARLAIGMFIWTLFCRYTLDRIMRRTAQRELNVESTPTIAAELHTGPQRQSQWHWQDSVCRQLRSQL